MAEVGLAAFSSIVAE
ncbi:hypothetical protein CISIN_1g0073712mg, partial [Citrus sinensis]